MGSENETENETAKHMKHTATNPLAHPPTGRPNDQPSRTSLPTHDVLQQYSSVRTTGLAWVHAEFFPVSVVLGFPLFIIRHPGERAIRPREGLSTPPAHRGGHRRPIFRRSVIGRLCGTCVAPQRGRGRPSGASRSCFLGVL